MAIRRRESEPTGRRGRLLAPILCTVLAASAAVGEESADTEPAPLGATAAALRERFGDELRPVEAVRSESVFEQIAPRREEDTGGTEPPTGPAQLRLARPSSGDVRRVEYDLSEGRVYRVRWRLAERFEHPILGAVVVRVGERLGRPDYDQTLRAELGSERADLRRTGWTLGPRQLEIRQLHPFTGGPIFLSLADVEAMQAIVEAKGVPLPQPETTGAWWRRPQRPPELPTEEERRELVAAIDALVAELARDPR